MLECVGFTELNSVSSFVAVQSSGTVVNALPVGFVSAADVLSRPAGVVWIQFYIQSAAGDMTNTPASVNALTFSVALSH